MRTAKTDQTRRVPRLIWVFAGRTCHFVGLVMRWLIYVCIWYVLFAYGVSNTDGRRNTVLLRWRLVSQSLFIQVQLTVCYESALLPIWIWFEWSENVFPEICAYAQSDLTICECILGSQDCKVFHADNTDSDQTARMRRLICVFVERTCQKIIFLALWVIVFFVMHPLPLHG